MLGLSAFFKGWSFIRKNGLTHYVLYPVLITLILWLVGVKAMTESIDWLKSLTLTYFQLPVQSVDPDAGFWKSSWETLKMWMNSGSTAIVSIIVSLVFIILMFLVTKYVMLALLSPALALISERTEEILYGRNYPFRLGRFIKDVGRGIFISLRNMFMESSLLLLIWVASLFVPVMLPVTAVLSVFITSYYYGYSMIDYMHERMEIPIQEGSARIRQKKGIAAALGIGIALSVQIPVIGFILAGCASLMAAVAAVTLDYNDTSKPYIDQEVERITP